MDKLLEVKNLSIKIRHGKALLPIVNDLSFTLHRGKTLAIVGESGCGKSLTALSILKLAQTPPILDPEGEAIYQNKNLFLLKEHELQEIRGSKIALISQDPTSSLNPVYTIEAQLRELIDLHLYLEEEQAFSLMKNTLKEVGIADPMNCLSSYPHQLSGGMRQRVMIAMALLCEPDILIADEPTTALDVTIQAQVLELIKHLQRKNGMAVLLITHDMGVVAEMADEVVVMYAGQAVECCPVETLFDKMAHPYSQGLFHSRPDVSKPRTPLQAIKGTVPQLGHHPKGCRFHTRCPYAMDKCKHESIPLFPLDAAHTSRCVLSAPSLDEESADKLKAYYDQTSP